MKKITSYKVFSFLFLLFCASSVAQAPVAVDDLFSISQLSCYLPLDILQNDTSPRGFAFFPIDLDPSTPGKQTEFQVPQGFFSYRDYNTIIFRTFPNAIPFGEIVSLRYTFQDTTGATSNVAVCRVEMFPIRLYTSTTDTTCDNPNSGSLTVDLFYDPNFNYQFKLRKDGVFYGNYQANNSSKVTISGLSVGNYEVYDFFTDCGPLNIGEYVTIGVDNPIKITGKGIYEDYNDDGIVSVGDVIKEQYTVTNKSSCTLTNVVVDFSQPELVNFTGKPIPPLGPNAINSSSLTATRVITQEDINRGLVQTPVYAESTEIPKPQYFNYVPIDTPLNTSNGIKLNAFVDTNNNGVQDYNEQNFNRGNFSYRINGKEEHVINTASGVFYLYESNPINVYNLNFVVNPSNNSCDSQYTVATPSYSNVTVAKDSKITTYNFAITTIPCNDVEVLLLPSNSPRPGFVYKNRIGIRNSGNQLIDSGTVTFVKDKVVTITSVTPSFITNNETGFTYNFQYLYPNEIRYIDVEMQMPTIPTVSLGQLVTNLATVALPVTDNNIKNDSATLAQIIIGSYDPNEKTEAHGGKILHSTFAEDDYLTYTILFENTGTAEAINVRVEDVLEDKLDEKTISMIRSSSNYVLDRVGSKLVWRFDGINLPPSKGSPTVGHGEITFQIKPKPGFEIWDSISNTANIYFDFNPPITTEPCITQFVDPSGKGNFAFNGFKYFPNPVKNSLLLTSNSVLDTIIVTSVVGQNIITQKAKGLQAEIDFSTLKKGVYFVKVSSKGILKTIKVMKD